MTITLVATSHGTTVPAARIAVTALVDAVQAAAPHLDVREAFVDVQEPSVDRVVEAAGGLAVVVPLLLTPGFHVHVDVRRAADHPWAVAADTLGPDPRLVDVLQRRLAAAGADRDDVVVLGAAGSTDPGARRTVDATAAMLAAARGAPVAVGHVGGTGAAVTEVVEQARQAGRRVVVASYLMAPGYFWDRLQVSGADVVSAPLLHHGDVEPELVSLVLDRFAAAAATLDWSAARQATVQRS